MALIFDTVLAGLNTAQREAVEKIDGPVMVVAGPGTGKTQVLAARIANILTKTDTQPYNILALTFTDSAAKNMQQRIVQMIGKAGYYVQITTFHSFCKSVIDNYPEYFPIARGSQAVTLLEQYELIERLVTENKLEALKPLNTPLFYVPDIIRSISQLKREGFSVTEFEQVVEREFDEDVFEELTKTEAQKKQKQKQKNQELALLYKLYEQAIREQKRFDFDDMIALVKQAFAAHPLLLTEQQERYHYFLVDEYQDTNSAQNQVVFQLASYWGQQANIFVVGDPHQSIYRFQGASLENIFGFMTKYPEATVINLTTGYRCPQQIYHCAHSVIQNNDSTKPDGDNANSARTTLLDAVSQPLTSVQITSAEHTAVQVVENANHTSELLWLATEIKQLIAEGVQPDEIAILYRKNKDAEELETILEKMGVVYQIDGGINVLETECIRQLLLLFKVVHDMKSGQENDSELFEVMCYEWITVDKVTAMKAARLAGVAQSGFAELIMGNFEWNTPTAAQHTRYQNIRQTITQDEVAALQQFIQQLQQWAITDQQLIFTEWFEQLINQSGYLAYIQTQHNHLQLLTNLNSLFNNIKALVDSQHNYKVADYLHTLNIMDEHHIGVTAEDISILDGAVTLSTVHKAKGREWQYVFIVHCNDGTWGNSKQRELIKLPDSLLQNTDLSKKERNEDDRRLFYVAITRAKKQVVISYPRTQVSGTLTQELLPSMFITELGEVSFKQVDAQDYQQHLVTLLQPVAQKATPSEEAFFTELVQDFALSVTSLNKYLADPLSFKFDVLLRVPKAKQEHMVFGTAMHAALELLYRGVLESRQPTDLEMVLERYQYILDSQVLSISDYQRRLIYGKDILTQYYQQLAQTELPQIYQLEQSIGHGIHTARLDDVLLTGRLDRLDWIETGKTVRVVDYKTGSIKSRNEIEAKTQTALKQLSEREQQLPESIRGPYKRQLLFYKLLTEQDISFKPKVLQGIFEFVEPNKDSGNFTTHAFDLLDSDVEDLKELIRVVMAEIRSLQFLHL